jgi:hypothetical protein
MEKLFVSGAVTILILVFLAPAVLADSEPAKITADELTYDYQMKQLEASGNVKIIYKDVIVESDKAFIDQEQNVILAVGNVRIAKKDSNYTGARFLYYMITEQGLLSPVKADIRDTQINGPIKFSAMEAYFEGGNIKNKRSTFTGCDLDRPHYHFTAKAVEYYPEDRVVLHSVWYWEQRVPLFYLPIFFISLKHEDDNFEVEVGHNELEGWFVKIGYNYIFNSDSYGKVTTRLTEKGSNELGVKHYLDFNSTSRFFQDYSFMDKTKLGFSNPDYKYGFGYENRTNQKLQLNTSFTNWTRQTSVSATPHQERIFHFNLSGQSPYPSFGANYFNNNETDEYVSDLNGSWNYNPEPTLNIALSSKWFLQKTLSQTNPVNNFQYIGSIRKDWIWSNVFFNYDETKVYSGGGLSKDNVKPEIIYTIPKWQWPLVGDVRVISQYLNLERFNNDIVTDSGRRWALDVQKIPIDLWKTEYLTLNWQSKFLYRDFFINQRETELYALSTDIGLIDRFTKEFSTEFRLGYTETNGFPNVFFNRSDDNSQNGGSISNEWKWQSMVFNASLRSKYYFTNQIADPLTFLADWTPAPGKMVHFDTVYNWNQGVGPTTLRINYNPKEDWRLALNIGYNFRNESWFNKEFEAFIIQQIASQWQMKLSAKYNMMADCFVNATTGLVYDWHCRKVRIDYDWIRNEYQLQITFNAIPYIPFKFSSETYFEGLLDALNF